LPGFLAGGFCQGSRTQILGLTTALSTIALWAVGDTTLTDLIAKLPVIFGGLGLAALGAKVNDASCTANRQIHQGKMSCCGPVHGRFMQAPIALLKSMTSSGT
jgi:hypothetical protein